MDTYSTLETVVQQMDEQNKRYKGILLQFLKQFSYQKGYFILASGKHDTTYIDCKKALLQGIGSFYASKVILHTIIQELIPIVGKVKSVAGVALGGCSLASGVSTLSFAEYSQRSATVYADMMFDALYVRKNTKNHGSNNLVEGFGTKGDNVILLEDVITSGGSSIVAIDTLKNAGYNVVATVCVIDRLAGGVEAIEKRFEIPVVSLYTMKDFE